MADIHMTGSLEQCFLQATGADKNQVAKLDWLEQSGAN
jgi:hypothetical protein